MGFGGTLKIRTYVNLVEPTCLEFRVVFVVRIRSLSPYIEGPEKTKLPSRPTPSTAQA